ncbi:MAG: hypothetical protein KDD02_03950 [Phaeodactylibacter sp.]|nr:hypothetical protein [Phaeodactylibacter sp.]MCB9302037.1 hypothetical protein [Lewinellaceae bacterium]HQU58174.1 hypothetical protein [Saprospiraceae bacterium]
MKRCFLLLCCSLHFFTEACADTLSVVEVLNTLEKDIQEQWASYEAQNRAICQELHSIETAFAQQGLELESYIRLLNRKMDLLQQKKLAEDFLGVELTKIRYKKGLELMRLLYEKVLGLDHHFSTLQTYQDIMLLSNPNAYPEFQRSKSLLEKRLKKENALQLPGILNSNPYLSTTFSLITSLIGGGDTAEREKELSEVSCILDFTARMYSELSTIYYETEYLKQNNVSLKEDCIGLFADYVGVINYHTALDVCRKQDDWEAVYESLGSYILNLQEQMKKNPDDPRVLKQQINLEFAVDRLIDFINKYNNFIAQGTKYYQKFEIILSNYPNEQACKAQLPVQFSNLKKDVQYSIDRFNEAYNIAELKGSKLKDLLYGFSD